MREEGRTQDFFVILCLTQVPHNMSEGLFVVIIVTLLLSPCVSVWGYACKCLLVEVREQSGRVVSLGSRVLGI